MHEGVAPYLKKESLLLDRLGSFHCNIEDKANKYPEGFIMMDAPSHPSARELIEIASGKADRNVSVDAIV